MNPLTYETKRAHWKATWFAIDGFRERAKRLGQPMLADMTPARFDVLYTTWAHLGHERTRAEELGFRPSRRIPMQDLRQRLGLAGATVSRMAHQLEAFGYVRVVRDDPDDRRCVAVILTDLGVFVLQLAIEWITLQTRGIRDHMLGFVRRRAADGLSREGSSEAYEQRVFRRLCTIVDRTRAFARFLGSRAEPIFDSRVYDEVPQPDVLAPFYARTEETDWDRAWEREARDAYAYADPDAEAEAARRDEEEADWDDEAPTWSNAMA